MLCCVVSVDLSEPQSPILSTHIPEYKNLSKHKCCFINIIFTFVWSMLLKLVKSSDSSKSYVVYLVLQARKSRYECQFNFFCFFFFLIGLLRHSSGWP